MLFEVFASDEWIGRRFVAISSFVLFLVCALVTGVELDAVDSLLIHGYQFMFMVVYIGKAAIVRPVIGR